MHLMSLCLLGKRSEMILIAKVFQWHLFWFGHHLIRYLPACQFQANVVLNCWHISWKARFWLRNLFRNWPPAGLLFFCIEKRRLRQRLLWFTYFNVWKHSWGLFASAIWWLRHGHLEFLRGLFCINPWVHWSLTWVFWVRPWRLWKWRRADEGRTCWSTWGWWC